MKKFFTLIAMAVMAMGTNAETLINFAKGQDGITLNGTTTTGAVNIKTNSTGVQGIKFANGYTTDDASNGNNAELTVTGGFKKGDVIKIAGAFNNSDNSKVSKVDIFTLDGTTPTVLFTTSQFINGRLVDDDPVEETYTLAADADKLYLGRNGGTATYVTTLKVIRGEETPETEPGLGEGELINFSVTQDGITLNGTTTAGAVNIKTNTTGVQGIKFANGYTTDGASNGNNAELTVAGGFKKGDVVTIAGAFNNSDNSKVSKVDIFTLDGTTPTVLFTTSQFINGRLVDDDPVEETYTLAAATDKLYLGRNGGTATYVTTLKVVRSNTDGINQILDVKINNAPAYNIAGQKVADGFKGVVIKNGKKVVVK